MRFLIVIELSHNAPKENPMKTVLIAALLTLAAPTFTIAATPIDNFQCVENNGEGPCQEFGRNVMALFLIGPQLSREKVFSIRY